MRESFFIKRDLIEQAAECEEALAVGVLLAGLKEDDDCLPYLLTSERVLYAYLFGEAPSRSRRTRIKNGLMYLQNMKYIQMESVDRSLVKIKFNNLSTEQQDDEDYLLLYTQDLVNIFRAKTKINKFSLFSVFCMIVRFINNPKNTKEYQNKCCRLPKYCLSESLCVSPTTLEKYINELERLKIIYVCRSNGRYNPITHIRETNIYSRYSDKDLCNEYAQKLGYTFDSFDIRDTNFRRKMKQIYNQICKGKIDYPEGVYDELIMYINDAETAVGYDINIVYEAQKKALEKML